MNQIATTDERLPMNSVGMAGGATGAKIAPQNLGEVVKFAEVMCRADIALPKHLRGNAGACMAVALQALEWQLSPFAVASKSYSVNGAIAYEAQLIAAVVNTRSGIKGRLKYHFDGEGSDLRCTVTGMLDGEECTYTSPRIGDITTKNSPLWKSDPQQQLGYFAARSWARRHCPEVILGVYDRDETEQFRGPDRAKDITPIDDPLSDEPLAVTRQQDADGERYDAETGEITRGTETRSTATETATTIEDTASDKSPSETVTDAHDAAPEEDGSEVISVPSSSDTESADPSSAADNEGGEGSPPASPSSPYSPTDRANLIECAAKLFGILDDERLKTPEERRGVLEFTKDAWKAELKPEHHPKLKGFVESVDAIIRGKQDRRKAVEYFASVLDCEPDDLGGAS